MKNKDKRSYRPKGQELTNLSFTSAAEEKFIKNSVKMISGKIRRLRIEKGLSQERLAELADVSLSTIRFIELNQRAPSLPMLFKLIFVLDKQAKIWE
ncbi:MAG: helix-turn-helix transcriptional regulator [Bacteriovoracia bacterium]